MNWNTILVSFLTSGFVTLFLNTIIKGSITHFFNRKMENFKNDLSLLTEEKKLDFQRKIYDFGLYSTKRHEIYPKIYKNVIKSTNSVSYLISILELKKSIPDIDEKQDEFILDLTRTALEDTEGAFDYFIESELYLSENISDYSKDIVNSLLSIARDIAASISLKRNLDLDNPNLNVLVEKTKQEIYILTEKTPKLTAMMRSELRIGDYEK